MIGNLISSAYYIIPLFVFRSDVSLTNKPKITKQQASSNGFNCQPMALYSSCSYSTSCVENKEIIA